MKKTLALLLALTCILALFVSCNIDSLEPSGSPATSAAPAQSSEPAATSPLSNEYENTMPIADSLSTLTAWRPFSSTLVTSPNEILCNIELEKRTNIHIDYKLVATADAMTQYNLMINSGDYTDLVFQGLTDYPGGMDKAIADNFVIEMTDALNKWMPNLKAYMDNDSEIYKQMHTDSGNLGQILNIQNGKEPAWIGSMIRKDFMERVGVTDVPVTFDDWYNVLTKFKTELNIEQPLVINYQGYAATSKAFIGGYDVDGGFYNENGTVKFGFKEPGFKDYITMMNKWYSEGLIDRDFYTRTGFGANDANVLADKVGSMDEGVFILPEMWKAMAENKDFYLVATPLPVKTAGDSSHFRRVNNITGTTAIAVTTAVNDADKLEKAARWIDYRFTEEGGILLNYGIEEETFEFIDSKPQYNDVILKDPEGRSFMDMVGITTDSGSGAFYDWTRSHINYSKESLESMDIWTNSASGDWIMPPVTLTQEEGAEYTNIYGDIDTLITETIPLFITGAKPMTEYGQFIDQLKSMNIDRCIDIQQAALDRYMNR